MVNHTAVATLHTNHGDIVVNLYGDHAPRTVQNFIGLSDGSGSWTDPATGYRRRAVSPVTDSPLELVEVELPAGASVSYPADAYIFKYQQLWILDGHLRFHEGPLVHDLRTGDCLQLGPPSATTFHNPGTTPCRYLVALVKGRS